MGAVAEACAALRRVEETQIPDHAIRAAAATRRALSRYIGADGRHLRAVAVEEGEGAAPTPDQEGPIYAEALVALRRLATCPSFPSAGCGAARSLAELVELHAGLRRVV